MLVVLRGDQVRVQVWHSRETMAYVLQKSPILTGLFAKEPYVDSMLLYCGSSSCAGVALEKDSGLHVAKEPYVDRALCKRALC